MTSQKYVSQNNVKKNRICLLRPQGYRLIKTEVKKAEVAVTGQVGEVGELERQRRGKKGEERRGDADGKE